MLQAGGESGVQKQHEKGKLTARERISTFLDDSTFIESNAFATVRTKEFGMDTKRFPGDGVVAGSGKVNGRQVFLSSQDFTVLGGSLGEMHAFKIASAQELALQNGVPFVSINDSGGARIQEGVLSLEGYARIFKNNTLSSGVIPQISVILGPCAGGAVYSPAITDFIFMVDNVSHMYITGPAVIKAVTGEDISHEELGGPLPHCGKSGVAHFRFTSEEECFEALKRLLSYLPSNNRELPPVVDTGDPADRKNDGLFSILPEDAKRPYDVKDIIAEVYDKDSFLEVHADYAKNIVVGFAKLAGRTVGIMANQPKFLAASLDIDSSDKAARFLRFCDAFNVPITTLVDVPGYLPGIAQEHGGIIRHGAKLLYAIAEANVPKIAVILRKAYGGSMIAMSSKTLGYDRTLAWPTAEIAVMGAEGAANIIFRKDIDEAEDKAAKRAEKIEEFRENFMNPYIAAELGIIDDVIDPAYTRIELIRALELHSRKREEKPAKKHGNIPL
ncbi:MAG: acyl-CoA carboxylase subunit beta [Spirochaetales bacterium]|nr:acyl-CoA carboxylase subunit beta [Spirochaetales bacterium]